MKAEIAVYTAQEGYSWQPGTKITALELKGYKACIGKFPSPDAEGFPFGGVFLKDDKVVFYRYHVAKKIDFRGRDALYCVLGALPKAEASQVDPNALFALPEFAGVVKPFPTQAEVQPASSEAVPEWLKNLDFMSLDVRITGSQDDMKFAVKQEQTKVPETPKIEKPVGVPMPRPIESAKAGNTPSVSPAVQPAAKPVSPATTSLPKPRPLYKEPLVIVTGIGVLLGLSILVAIVLYVMSLIRGCTGPKPDENPPPPAAEVTKPGRDARSARLGVPDGAVPQSPQSTSKPGIADAIKSLVGIKELAPTNQPYSKGEGNVETSAKSKDTPKAKQ